MVVAGEDGRVRGRRLGARGLRLVATAVAAVVVAADQVTKTWALRSFAGGDLEAQGPGHHVIWTLWMRVTPNYGAAFGLGQGITPIIEVVVVLLLVGLLVFGRRNLARTGALAALGLGLVVGGAVGNLSDRVFRDHGGAVIDFIDIAQVGNHEYWPVFNVADSCIVVGAVLLAWRYSRSQPRRVPPAVGGPLD